MRLLVSLAILVAFAAGCTTTAFTGPVTGFWSFAGAHPWLTFWGIVLPVAIVCDAVRATLLVKRRKGQP